MAYRTQIAHFALAITALIFSFPLLSYAATPTQLDNARKQGLAWLYQNQKGDGGWAAVEGLDVQSTAAAIDAFINVGIKRGNTYNAAVAKLENVAPSSIDGQARRLAILGRIGSDTTQLSSQLQAATNMSKAWGALPGYSADPLDTALALSGILDTTPSYTNADLLSALCAAIVPTQGASGGWSYTSAASVPAAPAVVPTAYVVLLLQKINTNPARFTGGGCAGTSFTLSTLISNGVAFLATKQNSGDHGFSDSGNSGILETAAAYLAIQAVNPAHTALASAQDFLVGRQQSSGTWVSDPFQTALALQTLPPTILADTDGDGVPDVVESILGTNPAIADGRSLLPGNGKPAVGIVGNVVVLNAQQNVAFTYTLSASGGTSPYTFSLASGILPTGLTLANNGTISGTPTVAGTFKFIYQVRDVVGANQVFDGLLVVDPAPSTTPPPLSPSVIAEIILLLLGD